MTVNRFPPLHAVLIGASFMLAGGVHAEFMTSVALQPNAFNATNPVPPPLSTDVMGAITRFNANVLYGGGNEFEGVGAASPTINFGYGSNDLATASGAVTLVNGLFSDRTSGRYNLTTGLPPIAGGVNPGHWIEGNGNFRFDFSTAISALSFFGTDFGDFGGSLSMEFYLGNSLKTRYSFDGGGSNGDLTFFGIQGGTAEDFFDSVRFLVQGGGSDAIGLDSMRVGAAQIGGPGPGPGPGPAPIPEPGSLALAGLALGAAALISRRRHQRC